MTNNRPMGTTTLSSILINSQGAPMSKESFAYVIGEKKSSILSEWLQEQKSTLASRKDLVSEKEVSEQSQNFISAFHTSLSQSTGQDIYSSQWAPVKDLLTELSRDRAKQGFSPTETAAFVFS